MPLKTLRFPRTDVCVVKVSAASGVSQKQSTRNVPVVEHDRWLAKQQRLSAGPGSKSLAMIKASPVEFSKPLVFKADGVLDAEWREVPQAESAKPVEPKVVAPRGKASIRKGGKGVAIPVNVIATSVLVCKACCTFVPQVCGCRKPTKEIAVKFIQGRALTVVNVNAAKSFWKGRALAPRRCNRCPDGVATCNH
jgi:hypothetical protein